MILTLAGSLYQDKIRPRTIALTPHFQHEKDKFIHREDLEEDWEEEFFEILKKENRIQKEK